MINFQEIITSIILLVISLTVTNTINKFYDDYLFKTSVQWKIKNYYKEEFKKLCLISSICVFFIFFYCWIAKSLVEERFFYFLYNVFIIIAGIVLISFKVLLIKKIIIKINDKPLNKNSCIAYYIILIIFDISILYFSYISNFVILNSIEFKENFFIAVSISVIYFTIHGCIIYLMLYQKKIKTNNIILCHGENEKITDVNEIISKGEYIYIQTDDKRMVIKKDELKHIEIKKSDEIKAIEEENKRKYHI